MTEAPPPRIARAPLLVCAGLSSLGILGCGVSYLIALPAVTPAMLVSGSFQSLSLSRAFGLVQSGTVLLYAAALLPVAVALSIRQYRVNPFGIVLGGCIWVLSLAIEVFNTLPTLAVRLYPGRLIAPPAEMLPYLQQTQWIRFLAFDVAGFTLGFVAALIFAFVFRRREPRLAWLAVGSVAVFLLHLPFLWFSPVAAVALMGASICIAAATPLLYARLAAE
jgi:hypothetical protein